MINCISFTSAFDHAPQVEDRGFSVAALLELVAREPRPDWSHGAAEVALLFAYECARAGTSPHIYGWGRLHGQTQDLNHHAILSLGNAGSVLTACRGRWARTEPWSLAPGINTRIHPKCLACLDSEVVRLQLAREGEDVVAERNRAAKTVLANQARGRR